MSNRPIGAISEYLRTFVASSQAKATEDGQLLERFVAQQDEAAFTALVQRYGPLVYGLCRRVVGDDHAAEDAFQATFLVLVRKAGEIRKSASVGSWLYAVAYRAAVQARAATHRQAHQVRQPLSSAGGPSEDVMRRELQTILDQEVNRLPEKYRVPFLLCYLEGKTFDEAARQLHCPLGTISTRLATAREKLRNRLTRRGIACSAVTITAILAENTGSAAVPVVLVDATIRIAKAVAADQALTATGISAPAIALSEGVIRAMFMNRVKFVLAVLVLAVGLVTASCWILYRSSAADAATEDKEPAKKPEVAKENTESIEGTWAVVSIEGREVAPKEKEDTWRFTTSMILTRKDELGYKLNRGKKPYEIDILDEKKTAYLGIVDIRDGTMKMCLSEPPNRPSEFAAAANSGRMLIVFKRESKPDGGEKLKALMKERFKTAGEEFWARNQQFLAGRGTDEFLFQAARRLVQAEQELPDKSAVTALANHLRRMTEIENISKERFDAGRIGVQDYRAAQYWRLEAEIWLERALKEGKK